MTADRQELGLNTLRLLTGECMLTVLGQLSRGPVRPSDIEARALGVPRWTALRRLHSLAEAGFVRPLHNAQSRRERGSARAPQTPHVLTGLAREYLLALVRGAVDCEERWCAPPLQAPNVPGLWVLRLAADQPTRDLARALAGAPLRTADLQVRLPHLPRSTLLRRLRTLPGYGVLHREERGGEVRYGLTKGARHLVIVPLHAAQCECRRATPADKLRGGDLQGLLQVLAPVGRTSQAASGTCQWHLGLTAGTGADIYLTAGAGRIAVLTTAPMTSPQAVSHATSEAWCDALLRGDPAPIATTGDHTLFNCVFDALHSALLA
jgi:DNA-binding HxlR family transcriptional regulator